MEGTFNASEIYDIGIRIEENGKAFYLNAFEKTEDGDVKKLFSDLAKWEDTHIGIFQKLKSQLEGSETAEIVDPDNEAGLYLKAIADSHIFLNVDGTIFHAIIFQGHGWGRILWNRPRQYWKA